MNQQKRAILTAQAFNKAASEQFKAACSAKQKTADVYNKAQKEKNKLNNIVGVIPVIELPTCLTYVPWT